MYIENFETMNHLDEVRDNFRRNITIIGRITVAEDVTFLFLPVMYILFWIFFVMHLSDEMFIYFLTSLKYFHLVE